MNELPIGTTGTASITVTEGTIDTFAELTGDENPLHLDAKHAVDSMFGERVAHGALSSGVISAAITDLPGELIYLSQNVEFVAPVSIGDVVRAEATVIERFDTDRLRIETVARTDESVVTTGTATVLIVDTDRFSE